MKLLTSVIVFVVTGVLAFAETLSFVDLQPGESAMIVIRSIGPDQDASLNRLYQIQGGKPVTMQIVENPVGTWARPAEKFPPAEIGIMDLSERELFGLECYALYLRHGFEEKAENRFDVAIGYYRDGERVGEEKYRSAGTRLLAGIIYAEGDYLNGVTRLPDEFPAEILASITPPWVIEQRMLAERRPSPDSIEVELASGE